MKFDKKILLLLSIVITLIAVTLSSETLKNKSKSKLKTRSPSAMEYMNTFFAETSSKTLPQNKEKEHHKKNHSSKPTKLRFKENTALSTANAAKTVTASGDAPAASGSSPDATSTSTSPEPTGGNVEVRTEDGELVSVPQIKRDETLIVEQWFMIHSTAFGNQNRYPAVPTKNRGLLSIKTDENDFRINTYYIDPAASNSTSTNGTSDAAASSTESPSGDTATSSSSNSTSSSCPGGSTINSKEGTAHTGTCPGPKYFWFRLSGLNLYYSSSKTDLNILGAMSIIHIGEITKQENKGMEDESNLPLQCFQVKDADFVTWDVCGDHEDSIHFWFCHISLYLGTIPKSCIEILGGKKDKPKEIEIHTNTIKTTQPIIIVPLPSRHCNDGWNYMQNGDDWECVCVEGREQSPIDLPTIPEAIESPVKPLFQYEEVSAISPHYNTIDQLVVKNQNLKIRFDGNVIRIHNYKFGKVVTMDGAVYYAQEIAIKTPAEHTIDGEKYDMEVQVVHYGQSKGDIAKQIVLCFLFKERAGVYNRFLDDIDYLNLPSLKNSIVDLQKDIFIPRVFYTDADLATDSESDETAIMKPFSFYTYQGSLTEPPCTENTIIYVASKPLYIGSTALKLFQEAIRAPGSGSPNEDGENGAGEVQPENQDGGDGAGEPRFKEFDMHRFKETDMSDVNRKMKGMAGSSNRSVQDRNGRPVFHFSHEKYCGPDESENKKKTDEGHYEKIMKGIKNYFYVDGHKPSGIPNAFVVSNDEALGQNPSSASSGSS